MILITFAIFLFYSISWLRHVGLCLLNDINMNKNCRRYICRYTDKKTNKHKFCGITNNLYKLKVKTIIASKAYCIRMHFTLAFQVQSVQVTLLSFVIVTFMF